MSESSVKPRSLSLLIAAAYYVVSGIYLLALTLTSGLTLYNLILLSVASVLAGAGLYLLRRWGYWLAIIVFPLMATVAASTLYFSLNVPTKDSALEETLFDFSLAVLLLLSFVSVLIVLDSRSSFKKASPQPSQTEPKSS